MPRLTLVTVLATLLGSTNALAADDSLERVFHQDGTYSYQLPDGLEFEHEYTSGPLTWRYVGQARYAVDTTPLTGPLTYQYDGPQADHLVDQLLGTELEDDLGRLWRVVEIDETLRSEADELFEEASHVDDSEDDVAQPELGQLMTWQPTSWDKRDCDSNGSDDWWVWGTDNRSVKTSPFTDRQETTVQVVQTGPNGDGGCTGTLIRDRWVLTAAHCTYSTTGVSIDFDEFDIFDVDGIKRDSVARIRASGYNWGSSGWDPNDDYALIKIASSFSHGETMAMSNASNSTINGVGSNFHNLGYPGNRQNCIATSSLVHTSNNDITGKNGNNIRWKGDSSGGHSGGPIYYCPTGSDSVCGGGETGFVVGVVAGWSNYYNRHMGPRVSNFSTWANTTMDNN